MQKAVTADSVPRPTYILRGHRSPIHALLFWHDNAHLVTADADGFLVIWSLATKRPLAVWQAHTATVLGLAAWGPNRLISHGRDGRLVVWEVKLSNLLANASPSADLFSRRLPVEDDDGSSTPSERRAPWILYEIAANAIGFCAFASCPEPLSSQRPAANVADSTIDGSDGLLIAVPSTKDSHIEIHHLPQNHRLCTVPPPAVTNPRTGLVMAIRLLYRRDHLVVVAGYEAGYAAVLSMPYPPSYRSSHSSNTSSGTSSNSEGKWTTLYTSQPHSEPILSLDVSAQSEAFYTSSADALIVKHPLPVPPSSHFSEHTKPSIANTPTKILNTHHAGQQSLILRPGDARIFATAGWDKMVRVYSAKTLAELAVLKWHREGCFAVAFADVSVSCTSNTSDTNRAESVTAVQDAEGGGKGKQVATQTVSSRRADRAKMTHWLAAGAKDGRVSLWDVY